MANINQTVIVRTDLFNLPEDIGLLSAQVAHIHFETARSMLIENATPTEGFIGIKLIHEGFGSGNDFLEWIKQPYLFVKKVGNLESLHHLQAEAINACLPVRQWIDTVYVRISPTIKKAFPKTLVGIAIGPSDADKIRSVVGDLPLL